MYMHFSLCIYLIQPVYKISSVWDNAIQQLSDGWGINKGFASSVTHLVTPRGALADSSGLVSKQSTQQGFNNRKIAG